MDAQLNAWNASNWYRRGNYRRVRRILREAVRRYGPLDAEKMERIIYENDVPFSSGLYVPDLIGATLFWQEHFFKKDRS